MPGVCCYLFGPSTFISSICKPGTNVIIVPHAIGVSCIAPGRSHCSPVRSKDVCRVCVAVCRLYTLFFARYIQPVTIASVAPRNINIAAGRLHHSPSRFIVCAECVPWVDLSNLFNLKLIKASFSCHQREVCSELQTSLQESLFAALEAFTGHMLLVTGYLQSSALIVTKHSSRFQPLMPPA